jgi:hypothetical protein
VSSAFILALYLTSTLRQLHATILSTPVASITGSFALPSHAPSADPLSTSREKELLDTVEARTFKVVVKDERLIVGAFVHFIRYPCVKP